MSIKPPYLALIKNNLQRFDIADHRLLGDAMFNLSQEQLKDLISDDGYGRVFSGFTPTWTAGTNTIDFTTGVAVNSDGELMVRDTAASHTITPVNSKVYGVYAVIEEIVDTALVSRRKWNGTVEVVDNSVPVKTFKKVSLGEVSDTFSGSFSVGSLFPAQVSSKTILPLAAVTVDSGGVKTFYDCRRMWAVNGNVQSSIGLAEETHNFAPADNETLGITGVRTFFRAVADRIKAITGKSNWWTSPAYNLQNLWDMLGTGGTGVRRIRTVAAYTDLVTLAASNGDFAYSTAQSSLYQFIEGSTVSLNGFRVVDHIRLGVGSDGRWVLLAHNITDVAGGFAGLDVLGVLSQTDVIKTSNIRDGSVTSEKTAVSARRIDGVIKILYVTATDVTFSLEVSSGLTGWSVVLAPLTQSYTVPPGYPGAGTVLTDIYGFSVRYTDVLTGLDVRAVRVEQYAYPLKVDGSGPTTPSAPQIANYGAAAGNSTGLGKSGSYSLGFDVLFQGSLNLARGLGVPVYNGYNTVLDGTYSYLPFSLFVY